MITKAVIVIFVVVSLSVAALAAKTDFSTPVILNQNESPVTITNHICFYFPEYDNPYKSPLSGIAHEIKFKKISKKEIVAIKFGFVEFDAFNNLLDNYVGLAIEKFDTDEEIERRWRNYSCNAYPFKLYGTGIVYVYAVRFSDGGFWYADLEQIVDQLKKYESKLKKEDLEEKEDAMLELLKKLILT